MGTIAIPTIPYHTTASLIAPFFFIKTYLKQEWIGIRMHQWQQMNVSRMTAESQMDGIMSMIRIYVVTDYSIIEALQLMVVVLQSFTGLQISLKFAIF